MRSATTRRRYLSAAPAAPLGRFVESLWVHSISSPEPGDDHRRILPDGRIDLVWLSELGVLVAGPQSRHTWRPVDAPLQAFGARFHPGAAPALLRVPARELVDAYVPLEAIEPALARRLDARLAYARDAHEAFAALEEELMRSLDDAGEPDALLRTATRLLGDGSATVADVAKQVYVSERQLERRFAERVGYGPKTFQRIVRFQRAVGQIRRGGVALARAAASAGYADQAHMTRESRRLAGLSPRQLVNWIG
jgi:AraC-like DNA-binding protein